MTNAQTLAISMYNLIAENRNWTKAQMVARLETLLEACQMAATADIFDPLRKMWQAGWIVSLSIAPDGKFACRALRSDEVYLQRGISRWGKTPSQAVAKVWEEFKRMEGLEAKEEMEPIEKRNIAV